MSKKKLKRIIGGCIVLISLISVNVSFSKTGTSIVIENTEALAQDEVNIFDLCKKAGGHCMVSITQNILGICIDHD